MGISDIHPQCPPLVSFIALYLYWLTMFFLLSYVLHNIKSPGPVFSNLVSNKHLKLLHSKLCGISVLLMFGRSETDLCQ